MNSKKYLRIFFFSVLITAFIAVVSVSAASKVLRFDGKGNIGYTVTNVNNIISNGVENGAYRISANEKDAANLRFTINAADQFALYDFPYIRLKLKNNYDRTAGHTFQMYLCAPSEKYYCMASNSSLTANKWQHRTYSLVESDPAGDVGKLGDPFPTETDKKTLTGIRFDVMRQYGEAGSIPTTTYIEYIAFFSTRAEAEAYDYQPIELRFDSDEDTALFTKRADTAGAITSILNNKFRIAPTAKGIYTYFDFDPKFNLYDYPFVKYKYKSGLSDAYGQFYITNPSGGFIYANFDHSAATANKDMVVTYTIPTDGGKTNGGGVALTGGTAATTYPSSTNKLQISNIFITTYRGSTSPIATTDFEYIAFFHTKEEMDAYGNDLTPAMDACKGQTLSFSKSNTSSKADACTAVLAQLNPLVKALNLKYDVTLSATIADENFDYASGTFKVDVSFHTYKSVPSVAQYSGTLTAAPTKGTTSVQSAYSTVDANGYRFELVSTAVGITPTKYYWYRNTQNSINGAISIAESVENTVYVNPPAAAGNYYYFAVASDGTNLSDPSFTLVTVQEPKSVVYRFDNHTDAERWSVGTNVKPDSATGKIPFRTDINGNKYVRIEVLANGYWNSTFTAPYMTDLKTHPYFVMKYRRTSTTSANFYTKSTFYSEYPLRSYRWSPGAFLLPFETFADTTNNAWKSGVIDAKHYAEKENFPLTGNTANPISGVQYEWTGRYTGVMIQPGSGTTSTYMDIDFMAYATSLVEAEKVVTDEFARRLTEKTYRYFDDDYDGGTIGSKIIAENQALATDYGVTISNVVLSNVKKSSVNGNGSFDFSIDVKYGSTTVTYSTGLSGILAATDVTITAVSSSILIGGDASITASPNGFASVTGYAWYYNTTPSTTGATLLAATTASLSHKILNVGGNYFYCIVSGTDSSGSVLTVQTDYLNVIGTAPIEPKIWRFNNDGAIALWNYTLYNKDGVGSFLNGSFHKTFGNGTVPVVSDFSYMDAVGKIPAENQFYIQAYPYAKIKYKNSAAASRVQLYIANDSWTEGIPYISMGAGAAKVWSTVSINLLEKNLVASGSVPDGKTVPTFGKVEELKFWVWPASGTLTTDAVDIEYIAFFPNSDAGKLAWQNFDSATPAVANSSDVYLPDYAAVKDVFVAIKTALRTPDSTLTTAALAKTYLTTVVTNNLKPGMTFTVSDSTGNGDNSFKFNVTINKGTDVACKSIVTKEVEVTYDYPKPVIWDFNNPYFFSLWSPSAGDVIDYHDDADGTYLKATMKTAEVDDCNITYNNIPETSRFDIGKYHYFAIRYRSTHDGLMQFYPAVVDGANTEASGAFYRQHSLPIGTGWTTHVVDIATLGGPSAWEGILKYLRLDFMRPHKAQKSIDIDYIAFFSTEPQANAFVANPYVLGTQTVADSDLASVNTALFTAFDIKVTNETQAKAKIENIVKGITLSQGSFAKVVYGTATSSNTIKDGSLGKLPFTLYIYNGPLGATKHAKIELEIQFAPSVTLDMIGAQVRTPGGANQGLRFGTKLSTSALSDPDITNITYGTVLLPENLVPQGTLLTLNTVATNGSGVANVLGTKIYAQGDGYLIYTAVITDIPPTNALRMARKISARGYVKFTFNAQEYIIYSDAIKTRSVDDVLKLINSGYSPDDINFVGIKVYDNATYIKPFWKGNTVYYETFWPVMPQNANQTDDLVVKLMYPISDILSVKNGNNTVDYKEGIDYFLRDGKLVIPATSAMKRTPYSTYISDVADADHGMKTTDGKNLYFTEGVNIQSNFQYSITYHHSATWSSTAFNPDNAYDAAALNATRAKLASKQPLKIAFFGDSITAGGNNTGNYNTAPYTPKWSVMIQERLKTLYGYDGISIVNRAVGGKNSTWGANGDANSAPGTYAKTLFTGDNPDLFVLAFGMNDEATGTAAFKANIESIINQIIEINPNCEFLLVSTSMPNPIWNSGDTANRSQYEGVLETVATSYVAQGKSIDVAHISEMHNYFLTLKEFRDMTGNNVNHQNDFLTRIYAQTILAYITNLN